MPYNYVGRRCSTKAIKRLRILRKVGPFGYGNNFVAFILGPPSKDQGSQSKTGKTRRRRKHECREPITSEIRGFEPQVSAVVDSGSIELDA